MKYVKCMLLLAVGMSLNAFAGEPDPVYQADWRSIATHQTPEWLANDKFGIFVHWLPNSVPAFNDEWYARWMYVENHEVFAHHRKAWGDQGTFGYKDFIPMFKAEKWDPEEWAAFFKECGARFVVPNAEHHCHFAMWDSALTKWDSVEMGPKRDIVGDLSAACRKAGLRFGVSNHRARGWNFFTYKPEFDTMDPDYADFYWPQLGREPDAEWLEDWQARLHELVDKYQPDLMWFDYGWSQPAFEPYKKDYAAYYYNEAAKWGKQVGLIYKGDHLPKGAGILDVERGKLDKLWPELWMTDTTVFKNTWGYVTDAPMKPVNELLHDLIDIVSKNGTLLLNVGPKPDGTIPEDQRHILREMGKWLKVNGEAIYGTRPFMVYQDGENVRYTRKGRYVYATFLERPGESATLAALAPRKLGGLSVVSAVLLDGEETVEWASEDVGLKLEFPESLPGSRAWVVKIELQGIGFDRPTVRIEHRPEGGGVFAYGKVRNFTDELQNIDVRFFINGHPSVYRRVRLKPDETGDIRFEHRDQNHYGSSHLLIEDLTDGIVEFTIGQKRPESSPCLMAFPAVSMLGEWLFREGDDASWGSVDCDESEWKMALVPREWPIGRIPEKTGWFRKTVEIPASWKGRDLRMNLGVILDEDVVWFNGVKVGEKGYEAVEFHFAYEVRKYAIPSELVKYGEANTIAVRVHNHGVKGGMVGPPGFITVRE